jgi:hypothetical protein
LVEHWNGTSWSLVFSPNQGSDGSGLVGVAAVSPNDIWAVGDYGYVTTGYRTLIEHWNGTSWSIVSSPNQDLSDNFLQGVAVVSPTDVWAVGIGIESATSTWHTLIEHWNGVSWSIVASPNQGPDNSQLYGVAALSASDVWAVGYHNSTSTAATLVEHWNGTSWSIVASPNPGTSNSTLHGIVAASANDIWAVGSYFDTLYRTLIEHWDGTNWAVIPSPNEGSFSELYGVGVVTATDVWTVGDYGDGGGPRTLAEHWNGAGWSVVPSPNQELADNTLFGVAAISANDVWAAGDYFDENNRYHTLVEHYSGCGATPTPTVMPTACPIQFSDVPQGSTFYTFIRCLACRNIVNGYADGTFKPNNNVTRGQLSKIVANSAGFNDPQTAQMFEDVPVGSTFQVYIGRLASRGYISGYPCGGSGEPCVQPGNLPYFRPNNNATRGQIAKIDANAAGFVDPPAGQTFEDVPPGSTFYTYTQRLTSRSIMQGYPCGGTGEPCVHPNDRSYFRPFNNATRGQTSKIVANTFFPGCQTPAR